MYNYLPIYFQITFMSQATRLADAKTQAWHVLTEDPAGRIEGKVILRHYACALMDIQEGVVRFLQDSTYQVCVRQIYIIYTNDIHSLNTVWYKILN